MYIITKEFVTKVNVSKDGKEHRRTNYFGGIDNFGGFGVENWADREHAKKYEDRQTAEKYARYLGGKVVEL